MKSLNINSIDEKIVEEICQIFGGEYEIEYEFEEDLDIVFDARFIVRIGDLEEYITSGKKGNEQYRASILYSMYSCGWLIITDHKFPKYSDWKSKNPGMTLDHVLPKCDFPLLTFDVCNWQPLTHQENSKKWAYFDKKEIDHVLSAVEEVLKEETELILEDAYSLIGL